MLILALLSAPVGYYFLGLGLGRTIAFEAPPIRVANLVVHLEAVDFDETSGSWPLTSTVVYRNSGAIRGEIRESWGVDRSLDYKIVIASRTGVMRETQCLPDYYDACYFAANLGRADLKEGVTVAVFNAGNGQIVLAPRVVSFTHTTSYSLARWEGLMGI